ncbi:MAG: arylesterase [Paraperlucidibaca sp.]
MPTWIRSLWSVALCLAIMPASAASVLIYGDSISASYGMDIEQGWVSLLDKRLAKRTPGKHQVINASVSGETTTGGLRRLPALLKQHAPDVVVLELGGNDGLRGQSPVLMERNLASMIRLSRQSGARVVVLGMQIPPNYGKAYTKAFTAVFPRVAKAEGAAVLPFFLAGVGGVPTLIQKDGIHPNAKAQTQLLELAWPLILKAIN